MVNDLDSPLSPAAVFISLSIFSKDVSICSSCDGVGVEASTPIRLIESVWFSGLGTTVIFGIIVEITVEFAPGMGTADGTCEGSCEDSNGWTASDVFTTSGNMVGVVPETSTWLLLGDFVKLEEPAVPVSLGSELSEEFT